MSEGDQGISYKKQHEFTSAHSDLINFESNSTLDVQIFTYQLKISLGLVEKYMEKYTVVCYYLKPWLFGLCKNAKNYAHASGWCSARINTELIIDI